MKRQNVVLMLFLAVLLVASTAESTELENARQTVVLECAAVIVMPDDPGGDPGPMPPLDPAMQPPEPTRFLEVIAVSGTPEAPAISPGVPCGIAIGELMNNRFRLLSATPAAYGIPGATPDPDMVTNVPSVQYLFVSRPEPRWSLR